MKLVTSDKFYCGISVVRHLSLVTCHLSLFPYLCTQNKSYYANKSSYVPQSY